MSKLARKIQRKNIEAKPREKHGIVRTHQNRTTKNIYRDFPLKDIRGKEEYYVKLVEGLLISQLVSIQGTLKGETDEE